MAVVILKLYEKGKLDLEDPITKYLKYDWLLNKRGIEKVTLKMLLNHTSGLPEYNYDPILVSKTVQNPQKVRTVEEMLSHLSDNPMDFEPGDQNAYRNTNYALLSLVADQVTGDHKAFMQIKCIK